jgi:hypothetical protein
MARCVRDILPVVHHGVHAKRRLSPTQFPQTVPSSLSFMLTLRLLYLQPVGMTIRFKYYGVWKMAEGACILSGLGFHGYNPDGTLKWDRMTNVSPFALETAQNNKAYLEAWNQMTNKWLKNYVYLRVTPRGKKPGFRSAMATFTTSAVWHGFYPGYYLTFVSAAFIQTCGKCTSPFPVFVGFITDLRLSTTFPTVLFRS